MHAFKNSIAQRALKALSEEAGGIEPVCDGTVDGTKALLKKRGIDLGVLLPVATKPEQVKHINEWSLEISGGNILSFASLHPDCPDIMELIEEIKHLGFKGVKLHPDYQNFFVDEPRMKPIYKKLAQNNLITLFHAGVDIGIPDPCKCPPERMKKALPWFDGGPVVAAHLGGCMLWYEVEKHLVKLPLYLDTSFCFSRTPVFLFRRIIENHGYGRVLFGSDSPWGEPGSEIKLIKNAIRDENAVNMILGENARELLGINSIN